MKETSLIYSKKKNFLGGPKNLGDLFRRDWAFSFML